MTRRYRRGYQVTAPVTVTPAVALSANPHRRSMVICNDTSSGPISLSFGSPQPFGIGIVLPIANPYIVISDEDVGDMIALDIFAVTQAGTANVTFIATEDCGMNV